jgi:hypothetical protein
MKGTAQVMAKIMNECGTDEEKMQEFLLINSIVDKVNSLSVLSAPTKRHLR